MPRDSREPGVDPSEELVGGERLDQVVVGAHVRARAQLRGRARLRGEEHHREVGELLVEQRSRRTSS